MAAAAVARFTAEAPSVAYYSPRGPVYASTVTSVVADILKPDLLAPGNQIWAAWTPSGTDTNVFSGKQNTWLKSLFLHYPDWQHLHLFDEVLPNRLRKQRFPTYRFNLIENLSNPLDSGLHRV